MKHFLQSIILLMILTFISIVKSPFPYLCILLSGILMIIFAMLSLEDDINGKSGTVVFVRLLQFALMLVFSIVSFQFCTFIILVEYKVKCRDWIRILLPSFLVFICAFLQAVSMDNLKTDLPETIFEGIVLLIFSAVIYLVERLAEQYFETEKRIEAAVTITAVNEMVEKKLNRELMIKNYVTEQNARMEERENISRNIHNSVGHSITAAIMTLDAADLLFDTKPELAREKMNMANKRIHGSLDAIREAVRVLDEDNEYVEFNSLIGNLTRIADHFEEDADVRIKTNFNHLAEIIMISKKHTRFLEETLKELLTNGVKHGQADSFMIVMNADSRHIKLKVSDNGKSDFKNSNSAEKIRNGFGLKKIISYINHCGGKTIFENRNGFHAEIMLPLSKGQEV